MLLTNMPNPRINRRISVIKNECNLNVICVRRKEQDLYMPYHADVKHTILDINLPSSSHVMKRLLMFRNFQKQALKIICTVRPDILYAEGYDALLIANKYKKINSNLMIIYEVSDLREFFLKPYSTWKGKLCKTIINNIEKRTMSNVSLLAVTSMQFYDKYYYQFVDKNRVLYVPNIPDLALFQQFQKKTSGNFTIGFIGAIRYIQQLKMLVDAAERLNINVLFAGGGSIESEFYELYDYCKNRPYVKFTGKYNYTDEIVKLYEMVDCIYAVYDQNNPNVQIALPNKLYEAVICRLPIIVAKGTYLSDIVEQYQIGVSVDSQDIESLIGGIKQLMNFEVYSAIMENCQAISEHLCKPQWQKQLLTFIHEHRK